MILLRYYWVPACAGMTIKREDDGRDRGMILLRYY